MPTWIVYLQALATPAIALLAAAVAWGQWRTSRQKFVQDLFDRRFAVWDDVRKAQSEIAQTGSIADPRMMWGASARARFLFGADLRDRLEEYVGLLWRVHEEGKADKGRPSPSSHEAHLAYEGMQPIFATYMRMEQKAPGHRLDRLPPILVREKKRAKREA